MAIFSTLVAIRRKICGCWTRPLPRGNSARWRRVACEPYQGNCYIGRWGPLPPTLEEHVRSKLARVRRAAWLRRHLPGQTAGRFGAGSQSFTGLAEVPDLKPGHLAEV